MSNLRRVWHRLTSRGDRGATLVEYSLIIGLVVMGSTASFEMMDERIETNYSQTAADIGQRNLASFDVTTTTCGSCGSSTTTSSTTTVPATTTSTTTSTTTTSTTTTSTTTTTTTTTTAPPATTTTAAASGAASTSWTDLTYEDNNGWKAKTRVVFLDENGDPMIGAVVQVTITLDGGSTKVKNFTITNSQGKKWLAWGGLDHDDFDVTFTIDSITYNGQPYTPSQQSFTVED
jgi:Flp pilus assembly pilin Flp